MFLMKKFGSTRSASIWGLLWRNPKGFLILIGFRECTSHFRVFYTVDFHSALTLPDRDLRSEGWVKINNVKKFKTEMICAPPKSCQNQKSFRIPSKQPTNTYSAHWAKKIIKNLFPWNNLLTKSPLAFADWKYFVPVMFSNWKCATRPQIEPRSERI